MTLARIVGLLAAIPALMLAERYSFKQYGQDEGLSNLDIQCLMQDRTGFLWVGTDGGVFRYDGHRFRGYTTAQGLPSQQVYSLHQTSDGTIWAGTADGLARLSGDGFEKAPIQARAVKSLASDTRGNLYVSSAAGLWVATPAGMSGQRRFQLQVVKGAEAVAGIAVDPSGVVWFGCGRGICTLTNGRTARLDGMGLAGDAWDGLLFDTHGSLWVRSARLLFELPRGTERFVSRVDGLPFATRRPGISMDRDGEVYVPTAQGLAHRTVHGWDLIRRTHGLPLSLVDAFLQDREGSAWIALDGGGLVRWLGYKQWETFTESEGLNHDVVWGLARDARGTLWAATQAGLSRYDPRVRRWEGLANPVLDMKPNLALIANPDGTLWIGQAPGGVVHFNPLTGRMDRFGRESGLNTDWVYSMALGADRELWAGTSMGVYRGIRSGTKIQFQQENLPLPPRSYAVASLVVDSRGWVWVATQAGLCRLTEGRWQLFTTHDGLRRDSIEQLAEAPDHSIWVAYRDLPGVSRLDFPGPRMSVRHFDPPNAREGAKPYFLRFDRRGWMWLGTDRGLNRYDGKSWFHYDKSDGMAVGDCDQNAFLDDDDGSVWVGTSRGLSHFLRPDTLEPPGEVRPVVTALQLGGLSVPATGPVSVPYARRSLDATFTALTFVSEDSVRFRHRLVGLDETWTETRQREAHYPGLSPGRYRLQVQAAPEGDACWSASAEIALTVEAPWWRRWWAQLAALCLLTVLTRHIWRWRLQSVLRRQQELERAVADRTQKLAQQNEVALREKARAESEKEKVEKQKVEIERLLWESRQAERVKDEFVTNVSHEVRTPLNTIVGMSDLMLQSHPDEAQAECLRAMKESSASLLALMNGVLDFSNVEGGRVRLECTDFDLRALVRDALKSVAESARRKGLQLRTRFSPNFPAHLKGDATRVQQVVAILLDNAIKFTEKGFVEVTAEAQTIINGHAIMHVEVRDTGIGIPAEQKAIIFEPFRQADGSSSRRFGGTGLGLAMCSRLIGLMNGRIWVESSPGAGSNFHFTARFGLPDNRSEPACEHHLKAQPAGVGLHILLVEDNVVNQKLARRLLENGGHTVTCAGDGVQALEATENSQFDAILMDIQMPVMDGFEATAELRRRENLVDRRTPVLALTANAMQGDRERCLSAGMDGYVTKPINAAELLRTIAETVASRASTA